MSKALATPGKRALPSKEASLFKELLALYEARQLKKGLKTADQILKKFPEHGESLCMKGLILTHMGRREEGIDLVKKGVRLDLTSHIVWHVFGLVQKGEKNYEEALKSYTQALKFDKENLNILRDAAQLQTQLRLYDALVETRHTLLKLRPTLRQHWVALAVAYHLGGNLLEARRTLEHYQRTLKNVPDYDVEQSETLLYHIRVLEEMGETSEALSMLDVNAKSRAIVDRTAIMETRARLLSKLKSDNAEDAWRALIEHNADCYDYYTGYLTNWGLSIDPPSPEVLAILQGFSAQLPRAAAPRRLALSISTGCTFRELVKSFLLDGLARGIPSLFVDIKSLYSDDKKRQVVEELVEAARATFASDPSSSSQSIAPDPTTYIWTLYFLAQHYSYLSRPNKALSLIDIALAHTPTLPELHACKARIYKRAGDPYSAVCSIEEARSLDGQDRFLNTKTGKYLLRAGLVTEAEQVLGLFTKKDAASPAGDLEDMQSLLYLMETADAHYRAGKLNLALKKYLIINRIFNEIEDDQYDFHGYNLRKFTINAYFRLLKWEDRLRSNPTCVKAAICASQIYVAVHDDPSIVTAACIAAPLTDAEKKAKKKAKKAAQKVQEETKKSKRGLLTATTPSANEDKGLEAPPPKDEDNDGLKALGVSDPLEQAAKLLAPLVNLANNNLDVWITIYDVAIRRMKLLQAVRALTKAHALDSEHPEVHIRMVHLRKTVKALPQPPPAPIGPIFAEAEAKILSQNTLSLDTYNSQYLQRHSASAPAILAVAKVSSTLLQAPLQEVESTIFATLEEGARETLNLSTAVSIVEFLEKIKAPRLEEFRSRCNEKFEISTVFKPALELEALKQAARNVHQGTLKEDH